MSKIAVQPGGSISEVTIAYPLEKSIDVFISRRAYESDFLRFLTKYVDILELPIEYIEEGCQFEPDPDYLFVNIDTWGLKLFILREQGKIDTPFFIYFHVVYGQDIYISYLLPLLREEDIILVASEYSKKCLLNISEAFNVHVIPLCLDVEEIGDIISQHAENKSYSKKTIGYLGQIIPEKGIGALIECMPEIVADMKGNVTLNVVGPLSGKGLKGGESDYVKQLEKRVVELDISAYVNWIGALMGEEKYRILSQSDIFINPSVFKIETFGVVNTEALACGLPVICTHWSAFDEVVMEGKNGFFLDVEENVNGIYTINHHQLISLVTNLLKDDALLKKMKKEARKTAFNFHYRVLLPKLVKLLKKKEVRVKGEWDAIKNKTFLDFRHLFQKEWLDVINAESFDYKTYDDIYNSSGPRIKFTPRMRHDVFRYLSGRRRNKSKNNS